MHRPRTFTATFWLSACGLAQAGRPLQTEDAGVIDPRGCELEGARAETRSAGAAARQSSLQLACGIGAGTEVALQALRPRELALIGKT